jgi:hypothetical protein
MREIQISREVEALLRAAAIYELKPTGRRLDNGDWIIPVDDDTLAYLEQHQFEGETLNDTILRLVTPKS